MARKLLSVRNLKTSFFTHVGEVKAVRGISFDVNEGEVLGIVGESGSGKSVTSLSIMGLLQYPGRVVDGEILLNGEDILTYGKNQMRRVRGKEIAMIFQDPMTSLNPVYTIGNQIMEMILEHEKMSRREARARDRDAEARWHTRGGKAHRQLPARILRRHEAARYDSACAFLQPEAAYCRRTHHRA